MFGSTPASRRSPSLQDVDVDLELDRYEDELFEGEQRRQRDKGAARAKRVIVGTAVAALVLMGLVPFLLIASIALGGPPPQTDPSSCTGPSGAAGPATDLSPGTVDAINKLRDVYEKVAAAKGLAWPMLAGIDYRENGNDPNQSMLSGEPLGSPNPDNPNVTTYSKEDSVNKGADHLKEMAASVYGVTLSASSPADDVKAALLAYNRGFIYKRVGASWDTSPYVMNQLDAAHTDMGWPNVPGEPLAGRPDHRYGTFTIFVRLGGSAGCAGLSGNRIVAIAQLQIGLAESPKGSNTGPEIAKFEGRAAAYGEFWCADFVSWVYNAAGSPFSGGQDGGWRIASVDGLQAWLSHNGMWHNGGDGDVPEPGDVVDFRDGGHTGIVEKVEGDTLDTIEGNSSDMVARRSYKAYDGGGEITGWGRMKAAA